MTTEERLARLETDLARGRRLNRWLLAALGVSLGAWVLTSALGRTTIGAEGGPPAAKEIHAGKFVLEDDKGKPRGVLEMGRVKADPSSKVLSEGPVFTFLTDDGKPQVSWALDNLGVHFCDAGKAAFASWEYLPAGPLAVSTLRLPGAAAAAQVSVLKGGAAIGLTDSNGKARAALSGCSEGTGAGISVYDAEARLRACIGSISLKDKDGVEVKYPESKALLFDRLGKVLWSAP